MMSGGLGSSRRDVLRLFEGGSVAGLSDGELLERFAVARDEAAFEALVTKLGPMVLGVCRRMLADPHDVDDAFQATFLVLVRRAHSIRDRELVGPWLHGVATKVARRARAESIRRVVRERVAVDAEACDESLAPDPEWPELRAMIDEEIERLPENHRRPVILCDVEGLTREEAALQLGWSLNMVRGRLERARDRLRGRLTRRGLAPSGGLMTLLATPRVLPPALVATTCRAGVSFVVGRIGVASASAVALAQGVLNMMLLSKVKLGLAVVLSTGFVAGTGLMAAQGPGQKADPAKPAASAPAPVVQEPAKAAEPFRPRPPAELAKARLDVAREWLKAQTEDYEEGRITIDRLINASQSLMQAEINADDSKASRVEAARAHYNRLAVLLKHEEADLEVNRTTRADLFKAKTALLDAEFTLAKEMEAPETKPTAAAKAGSNPPVTAEPVASPALAKLNAERLEIARRMFKEKEKQYRAGAIGDIDFMNAGKSLLEAEVRSATTRAERIEAIQLQIKSLKSHLPAVEKLVRNGAMNHSEIDRARLEVLDAEAHLIEVSGAPEGGGGGGAPVLNGPVPAFAPAPAGPAIAFAPPPLANLNAERVAVARRVLEQAEARYRNASGGFDDCLNAKIALFEAEEAAATTRAGRVEAAQGRIKTLKDLLSLTEAQVNNAMRPGSDIDRVRLRILDAEAHLIEVSGAPEGLGGGAVPAPNGPVPAIVPAPSGAPKDEALSPLAKAVATFNQNAMTSAIGRDQPPLTEDEVIAAIRFYSDDNPGTIKGALDDFRMVSEKRDMPPGMRFVSHDIDDRNGEFAYEAWTIQIQIPNKTGGDSAIPIRSRVIRSLTLEEAIKYAEAKRAEAIQTGTPEGRKEAFGMEEYIKHLGRRIEQRGKSISVPSIEPK